MSVFVVDQKGCRWFLRGVLLAALVGLSFRLFFHRQLIRRELNIVAENLRNEVSLEFGDAFLSTTTDWGFPGLSLHVRNIRATTDFGKVGPIDIEVGRLVADLTLTELMFRKLRLSRLELDQVALTLPHLHFQDWEDFWLNETVIQDGGKGRAHGGFASQDSPIEKSHFQVVRTRPVEKVLLKLVVLRGPFWNDLGLSLKNVTFDILSTGEAQLTADLWLNPVVWGHWFHRLSIFGQWLPEDKLARVQISGMIDRGFLDIKIQADLRGRIIGVDSKISEIPSKVIRIGWERIFRGRSIKSELQVWLPKFFDASGVVSKQSSFLGQFEQSWSNWQWSLRDWMVMSEKKRLVVPRFFLSRKFQDFQRSDIEVTFEGFSGEDWSQWLGADSPRIFQFRSFSWLQGLVFLVDSKNQWRARVRVGSDEDSDEYTLTRNLLKDELSLKTSGSRARVSGLELDGFSIQVKGTENYGAFKCGVTANRIRDLVVGHIWDGVTFDQAKSFFMSKKFYANSQVLENFKLWFQNQEWLFEFTKSGSQVRGMVRPQGSELHCLDLGKWRRNYEVSICIREEFLAWLKTCSDFSFN